jgi:hypothetical protein
MSNALIDVECHPSPSVIQVYSLAHVQGQHLQFAIDEGMALIDSNGYIRFFVLEWEDGERCGYLLQPYYTTVSDVDPLLINGISWVGSAFAAYGLSKARTKIVNTKNTALDIGSFFLIRAFGEVVVTPFIKSFSDTLFSHEELNFGYRNIMTDKLIFTEPIRISSSW